MRRCSLWYFALLGYEQKRPNERHPNDAWKTFEFWSWDTKMDLAFFHTNGKFYQKKIKIVNPRRSRVVMCFLLRTVLVKSLFKSVAFLVFSCKKCFIFEVTLIWFNSDEYLEKKLSEKFHRGKYNTKVKKFLRKYVSQTELPNSNTQMEYIKTGIS